MMRPTFERGLGQEALALAEALVQTRTSPGILVFSGLLQLLYMNREARELCARIMQAGWGYPATGGLPPDTGARCEGVGGALRERPGPEGWGAGPGRRGAGDPPRPRVAGGGDSQFRGAGGGPRGGAAGGDRQPQGGGGGTDQGAVSAHGPGADGDHLSAQGIDEQTDRQPAAGD